MKKCFILLLISWSFILKAQERTIHGYVFDKDTNEPLIGVNVYVKADSLDSNSQSKKNTYNTTECGYVGTTTDIKGYFSITVNDTLCKYLKFAFLGYENYFHRIIFNDTIHVKLIVVHQKLTPVLVKKPVIYLYPEIETKIKIELDLTDGKLTTTYPEYENFWEVTAKPNGELTDNDGKKYSYLYWEGKHQYKNSHYNYKEGFIVPGDSLIPFFESVFPAMGLTYKEYNDLIVYWLPRMSENKFNFIHFRINDDYDSIAKIKVTPKPDTQLRVFMEYQPMDYPITIKKQEIKKTERKGFVLVEWGGSAIQKGLQIVE